MKLANIKSWALAGLDAVSKFLFEKIMPFSKQWPEVCYGIPIALLVFVFNDSLIHNIDPSAGSLSVEALSVLNFNILIAFVLNTIAYFFYSLCFHDFFKKGWEKDGSKDVVIIINYLLWTTVLVINYFVITRNL